MAGDHPNMFDWIDVRRRIWIAVQRLYLHDRYLIERNVMECAISHRLAIYLESVFPGWHVDCEFNKDGDDPKLAEVHGWRPDVIVHRRGKDGPNLLSVEVKKGTATDATDRGKLTRYVSELRYRWAVSLSLTQDHALCEWQGEGISQSPPKKLNWANLEEIGYGG